MSLDLIQACKSLSASHLKLHLKGSSIPLSIYVNYTVNSLLNQLIDLQLSSSSEQSIICHLWHQFDCCLQVFIDHGFKINQPFNEHHHQTLLEFAIDRSLADMMVIALFRGASINRINHMFDYYLVKMHSLLALVKNYVEQDGRSTHDPVTIWSNIPIILAMSYDQHNPRIIISLLKTLNQTPDQNQPLDQDHDQPIDIVPQYLQQILLVIEQYPSINQRLEWFPLNH